MKRAVKQILTRSTFTALALTGAGCGSMRFRDAPVVWSVDDRANIAEPEEIEYLKYPYFADIFFMRRTERALELHDREPAWNVNALEEVPDSSWFTNRIGRRDLTAEDVGRGPADRPPPKPPFTLKRG